MSEINGKQKRNKLKKTSNVDHKVFDKSKPKKISGKIESKNSKIIFDDDGNELKSTKKKNTKKFRSAQSFNQTDDVASRWYDEVSVGNVIILPLSFIRLFF